VSNLTDSCRRCPLWEGCEGKPGRGPERSAMLVLEFPGRSVPGMRLLDRLLKDLRLTREQCFVTHAVRHRPEKGRTPTVGEPRRRPAQRSRQEARHPQRLQNRASALLQSPRYAAALDKGFVGSCGQVRRSLTRLR